jgi:hypothetical protein
MLPNVCHSGGKRNSKCCSPRGRTRAWRAMPTLLSTPPQLAADEDRSVFPVAAGDIARDHPWQHCAFRRKEKRRPVQSANRQVSTHASHRFLPGMQTWPVKWKLLVIPLRLWAERPTCSSAGRLRGTSRWLAAFRFRRSRWAGSRVFVELSRC